MRLTKDIIAILIITLALIYGLLIFITHEKGKQLPPPVKKEVKIKRKYGFAVDSFMVYDGKIHYRQTLASILSEFNVSRKMINRLNDIPKDSFDITRIRAGNHYTAFCRKDSNQTLQYFVY